MTKNTWLKIANPLLFLSALIQILTGFVLALKMLPSQIGFFYELHEHNGMVFVVLLVIHIILNWGWVRANFLKRHKS
jgi:hypothetical protein